MMTGPVRRQQGLTFLGWALILVLVGFGVFLFMKVFPVYMNQFKVVSVLNTLRDEPDLARAPKDMVRRRLQKLLDVNSIDRPRASDAIISGGHGNPRSVEIRYEVRKPFTSQVDVVFKFDHSVQLARSGG